MTWEEHLHNLLQKALKLHKRRKLPEANKAYDEVIKQLSVKEDYKDTSTEELNRRSKVVRELQKAIKTSRPKHQPKIYDYLNDEFWKMMDVVGERMQDDPEYHKMLDRLEKAAAEPITVEEAPDPIKSPSWGSPGGEDPPKTVSIEEYIKSARVPGEPESSWHGATRRGLVFRHSMSANARQATRTELDRLAREYLSLVNVPGGWLSPRMAEIEEEWENVTRHVLYREGASQKTGLPRREFGRLDWRGEPGTRQDPDPITPSKDPEPSPRTTDPLGWLDKYNPETKEDISINTFRGTADAPVPIEQTQKFNKALVFDEPINTRIMFLELVRQQDPAAVEYYEILQEAGVWDDWKSSELYIRSILKREGIDGVVYPAPEKYGGAETWDINNNQFAATEKSYAQDYTSAEEALHETRTRTKAAIAHEEVVNDVLEEYIGRRGSPSFGLPPDPDRSLPVEEPYEDLPHTLRRADDPRGVHPPTNPSDVLWTPSKAQQRAMDEIVVELADEPPTTPGFGGSGDDEPPPKRKGRGRPAKYSPAEQVEIIKKAIVIKQEGVKGARAILAELQKTYPELKYHNFREYAIKLQQQEEAGLRRYTPRQAAEARVQAQEPVPVPTEDPISVRSRAAETKDVAQSIFPDVSRKKARKEFERLRGKYKGVSDKEIAHQLRLTEYDPKFRDAYFPDELKRIDELLAIVKIRRHERSKRGKGPRIAGAEQEALTSELNQLRDYQIRTAASVNVAEEQLESSEEITPAKRRSLRQIISTGKNTLKELKEQIKTIVDRMKRPGPHRGAVDLEVLLDILTGGLWRFAIPEIRKDLWNRFSNVLNTWLSMSTDDLTELNVMDDIEDEMNRVRQLMQHQEGIKLKSITPEERAITQEILKRLSADEQFLNSMVDDPTPYLEEPSYKTDRLATGDEALDFEEARRQAVGRARVRRYQLQAEAGAPDYIDYEAKKARIEAERAARQARLKSRGTLVPLPDTLEKTVQLILHQGGGQSTVQSPIGMLYDVADGPPSQELLDAYEDYVRAFVRRNAHEWHEAFSPEAMMEEVNRRFRLAKAEELGIKAVPDISILPPDLSPPRGQLTLLPTDPDADLRKELWDKYLELREINPEATIDDAAKALGIEKRPTPPPELPLADWSDEAVRRRAAEVPDVPVTRTVPDFPEIPYDPKDVMKKVRGPAAKRIGRALFTGLAAGGFEVFDALDVLLDKEAREGMEYMGGVVVQDPEQIGNIPKYIAKAIADKALSGPIIDIDYEPEYATPDPRVVHRGDLPLTIEEIEAIEGVLGNTDKLFPKEEEAQKGKTLIESEWVGGAARGGKIILDPQSWDLPIVGKVPLPQFAINPERFHKYLEYISGTQRWDADKQDWTTRTDKGGDPFERKVWSNIKKSLGVVPEAEIELGKMEELELEETPTPINWQEQLFKDRPELDPTSLEPTLQWSPRSKRKGEQELRDLYGQHVGFVKGEDF